MITSTRVTTTTTTPTGVRWATPSRLRATYWPTSCVTRRRGDVVVIGRSFGGLSAALTLGRCRRSVLVIGTGGPRTAAVLHAHGLLTRDGASPTELIATAELQLEKYESVALVNARVDSVSVRDADAGSDGGANQSSRQLRLPDRNCGSRDSRDRGQRRSAADPGPGGAVGQRCVHMSVLRRFREPGQTADRARLGCGGTAYGPDAAPVWIRVWRGCSLGVRFG